MKMTKKWQIIYNEQQGPSNGTSKCQGWKMILKFSKISSMKLKGRFGNAHETSAILNAIFCLMHNRFIDGDEINIENILILL